MRHTTRLRSVHSLVLLGSVLLVAGCADDGPAAPPPIAATIFDSSALEALPAGEFLDVDLVTNAVLMDPSKGPVDPTRVMLLRRGTPLMLLEALGQVGYDFGASTMPVAVGASVSNIRRSGVFEAGTCLECASVRATIMACQPMACDGRSVAFRRVFGGEEIDSSSASLGGRSGSGSTTPGSGTIDDPDGMRPVGELPAITRAELEGDLGGFRVSRNMASTRLAPGLVIAEVDDSVSRVMAIARFSADLATLPAGHYTIGAGAGPGGTGGTTENPINFRGCAGRSGAGVTFDATASGGTFDVGPDQGGGTRVDFTVTYGEGNTSSGFVTFAPAMR